MSSRLIDLHAIFRTLEAGVAYYEHTAPAVSAWLDGLYRRLHEDRKAVLLAEILFVDDLLPHCGWEHPSYAANKLLHLLHHLGRNTAGLTDH